MDPAMTIFRERLPGVPFLEDLFPSPSLSPHSFSLPPLCLASFLRPFLALRSALLSRFLLRALFYERRHRHAVSSTTVKALEMDEEGRARTCYFPGFIGILLDGRCTSRRFSFRSSQ